MDVSRIFRSKGDEEMERRKNEARRVAGSHKRDWDLDKEEQEEQDKPRKEWRVMDQVQLHCTVYTCPPVHL